MRGGQASMSDVSSAPQTASRGICKSIRRIFNLGAPVDCNLPFSLMGSHMLRAKTEGAAIGPENS